MGAAGSKAAARTFGASRATARAADSLPLSGPVAADAAKGAWRVACGARRRHPSLLCECCVTGCTVPRGHCSRRCAAAGARNTPAAQHAREHNLSLEEAEQVDNRDAALGSLLDRLAGAIQGKAVSIMPSQVRAREAARWHGQLCSCLGCARARAR
jgi:hypothetical protein